MLDELKTERWKGDADVYYFAHAFHEEPYNHVLEVGAHDEPIAYLLAQEHFFVTAVDLRRPESPPQGCEVFSHLFRHIQGEFTRMNFPANYFRAVVSTSTIEHFGIGTYATEGVEPEEYRNPYLDVIAMAKIWNILEPKGHAYITVPVGEWLDNTPHWRVYDRQALQHRIIQNFKVLKRQYFVQGGQFRGKLSGTELTEEEAFSNKEGPHATILLVMEKESDWHESKTFTLSKEEAKGEIWEI